MKKPVYTSAARVRINPDLLFRAQEAAQRKGMTLSELMRDALRREVRECA